MDRKKLAKELFKRKSKPKYPRDYNSITPKEPKPLSECNIDLTDFSRISTKNKNFNFSFTCIDIYSRYAWCIPIKNKSAASCLVAFKSIFENESKFPDLLTHDSGSEFKGVFSEFCANNGIKQRTVDVGDHNSLGIIDRFTRTLREKINEIWVINNNFDWVSPLPDILKNYNATKHTTTKNPPIEILKGNAENEQKIYRTSHLMMKFELGDKVRKRLKFEIFDKKTNQKWSKKIYTVVGYQGLKILLSDNTRHAPRDLLKTEMPDLEVEEQDTSKTLKRYAKDKNTKQKLKKLLDMTDEQIDKIQKEEKEEEKKDEEKKEEKEKEQNVSNVVKSVVDERPMRRSKRERKKRDLGFFIR